MMMGSDNFEQTRLYNSIVLDQTPVVNGSATNSYFKTHSSDASNPLSHPALERQNDSDPLLHPMTYRKLRISTDSYIETPTYADAIVSPFNDIDRSSRDSESSMNADYIRITVSNPQKEHQIANTIIPGSNTYVTYLITTRTSLPEFGGPTEFNVRRRFRDVVTLADRLAETYRGFFIPPRPDKSVVEGQVMQKQDFLEQRRVALEKYLKRLSEHPVIKKSDELKVFLKVQGCLPSPTSTGFVTSSFLDGAVKLPKQLFAESGVAPYEVSRTAKGGRELLRLFRELKQSVISDWGGYRHPIVEEDKDFLERKEKLHELEQKLSSTSQQAESLVKAQQDMGETFGDLGLAFIKLTKFETEEAVFNTQRARADNMKTFATAAVKASRLYRELNLHTIKHLDTLHEYLGLLLAVHAAFSDRSNALLTVQSLVTESSALHSRSEEMEVGSSKVFGGDKSGIRKIDELKEIIRLTEDSKNAAVREYEYIKENNRTELERTDHERHVDFLNMLKGFIVNQVGYAEKIAYVWGKVAEETSEYVKRG